LSNWITAHRRAHMKTPRGGVREWGGRRWELYRRKEDGMAGTAGECGAHEEFTNSYIPD